ncbi:MAG: phosphotransferase [Syntrophobacteraceae bacterium]|nr:phosphotransferase [Desulfobacteraceae bacterium]
MSYREHLSAAAAQFVSDGRVTDIREYGNGNINSTFLVSLQGAEEKHFILQRLNTRVFRQPELVMSNMRICTEHLMERVLRGRSPLDRRWEVPSVLPARGGADYWLDPSGSFWRAIRFIEAARAFDTIQDADHAGEVGRALGAFHNLIGDLPVESLADILPGFHVTPLYLKHYEKVLSTADVPHNPEVRHALRFVGERRSAAGVLEEASVAGKLRLRPIHGDPKVNNVMIDTSTLQAVGIVDLDTVKPGLIHYDVGDCLRSGCNPLGEETPHWEDVRFEPELCRAILRGYLEAAGPSLSGSDCDYLYDAVRLIAFELGLRFFTDYLEGNVYFKAGYPEHNLARALVQFRLAESVESRESVIRQIVEEMR